VKFKTYQQGEKSASQCEGQKSICWTKTVHFEEPMGTKVTAVAWRNSDGGGQKQKGTACGGARGIFRRPNTNPDSRMKWRGRSPPVGNRSAGRLYDEKNKGLKVCKAKLKKGMDRKVEGRGGGFGQQRSLKVQFTT